MVLVQTGKSNFNSHNISNSDVLLIFNKDFSFHLIYISQLILKDNYINIGEFVEFLSSFINLIFRKETKML